MKKSRYDQKREVLIERVPLSVPMRVMDNPSPGHAFAILEQLARAVLRLADAVDRQSDHLELFQEAMPIAVEARILGVSARTISKRRKQRAMRRLMHSGL